MASPLTVSVPRPGPRRLLLAALILSVGLLVGFGGAVQGGFSATVNNSVNSVAVGTVLLKSGADCDTAGLPPFTALPSVTCANASVLPAATPATATITVTADGTLPIALSGASATLTGGGCGPVAMANAASSGDPMLVRGGVGFQAAGPLANSAGITVDGVAANHSMLSNIGLQTSASLLGASFSAGLWFRVAPGRSGPLLGFGVSPNDTAEATSDYPVMWLDSAGKLRAGVRTTAGSIVATASSTGYADNGWHFALMTVTSSGLTLSITTWVDGVQTGSASGLLSLLTGFNGYWHAGWSPVAAAPWNSGTANYLAGSLADVVVLPSALTAAQVGSLASAGTQATWSTRVAALNALSSWPLGDDGTNAYLGSLPVIGTTPACSFVDVAIGGSSYCIYPNSISTSCAAPTAKLSTLTGPYAFAPLLAGSSATLTTTTARDSSYATTCASYCPGLHLELPATIVERYGGLGSSLILAGSQTVI